jgi:DNA-binding transcriptional regulator YiaG
MTNRIASRSFPEVCVECGKTGVRPTSIAYDAEVKYEGHVYRFRIDRLEVSQCEFCGDFLFDNTTHEQIHDALRKHLNLLSRREIRDQLASLGLTQKELGAEIAVAPETISRWLSGGYVQSRAYDKLMRYFFKEAMATRATHLATSSGVQGAADLPR